MIGKRLAHYEILEKLGQGGMGEVYKARDTKLGREVALKILPAEKAGDPERRKRLRREATAVAALKHPNIVTIYAVEEDGDHLFLTMELVEGQALDRHIPPEGLNLARLMDVAIPVADAVAYAHGKGITHRDLKPANIMLDESGRPKVLDFGLAKLLETESTPEGATLADDLSNTAAGMVLGTAAYMSPEQAEGKPTDARSDVFSLGIVLYEMATGRKPFVGDTTISTISSILKDTPPPVTELNRSLPHHLGRVVTRCLAKDPGRRYQVALEIKNELEGLKEESSSSGPTPVESLGASGSKGPRKSILIGGLAAVALAAILGVTRPWERSDEGDRAAVTANSSSPASTAGQERKMAVVLPFENLGPPEHAYFAAGMTEEITGRLASVRGLGVISRTSATQYDRSGKTMKQIGEDLGVDYVLEGSVRWAKTADGGGRVRISPRLIQVDSDQQIWTDTYDRRIDDIFQVQSDIAGKVIEELGVTLSGTESQRLAEAPTQNQEAYQAFLEAKDFQKPTFQEYDTGYTELLERATTLDPNFVEAWYELSLHNSNIYFAFDRTEGRLDAARQALEGAEAADPDHPLTRVARGAYYYYGYRDYDRALAEFTAVVEEQPNHAEARRFVGYILRRQGKLQESTDALEKAMELDPQNANGIEQLAANYRARREFDRAIEYMSRAVELDPDNTEYRNERAKYHLAATGDVIAAREMLSKEPGDNPLLHAFDRAGMYRLERRYKEARQLVRNEEIRNPVIQVYVNAFLALMEAEEKGGEEARTGLESAAQGIEQLLENAPTDGNARGMLSALHVYLGDFQAAVREMRMAVELSAPDKFKGPEDLEGQARVFSRIGREEEAMELLNRLLGMPYENSITVPLLRLQPDWDTLRERTDFQTLLRKHETRLP